MRKMTQKETKKHSLRYYFTGIEKRLEPGVF